MISKLFESEIFHMNPLTERRIMSHLRNVINENVIESSAGATLRQTEAAAAPVKISKKER